MPSLEGFPGEENTASIFSLGEQYAHHLICICKLSRYAQEGQRDSWRVDIPTILIKEKSIKQQNNRLWKFLSKQRSRVDFVLCGTQPQLMI
jgi:hypothetical protein